MNKQSIYESLGVTPVINAAGTLTAFGGSLMSPEVVTAWSEAARHFVDLEELQDRVGERIAKMLKVESALVTGGAASANMLATAAAITVRNDDFIQKQIASNDGQPYEVLRQKRHRDPYDRQIETCGVKIVEVENEQDVERLVSDRTVLMMAYNVYEPEGSINHEDWLRLADTYSLPTLLDAAADTPPVDNLWRYSHMGYAMVTFSGGKTIRGPQNSGLLLGRTSLIEAAKKNAVPVEGVIGRVAKVSKEDIVGLWRALEIHLSRGDQIQSRCQEQLRTIETMVSEIPTIRCRFLTPEVANHFPHLILEWDEASLGLTPDELATSLRNGDPRIVTGRVYGTGTEGLLISAINLQPGEERLIGARVCEIFQALS